MVLPADCPLRIAHRYGNSRRHLALAAQGPVDYIEADVWYQNGRLAVRHERKLGPLPILFDERTKDPGEGGPDDHCLPLGRWCVKLQLRPLYLDEVLALARGRRRVMVDVKGCPRDRQSAFARALAQRVRSAGMVEEVTFCGQNWPVLRRLRAIDRGLRVHYSIGAKQQLAAFSHVHQDETLRGVCVHHDLINPRALAGLKQRGLAVWTWTVDDPALARELVAMGIDGVISNRLDVLGALAEPTGLRAAP